MQNYEKHHAILPIIILIFCRSLFTANERIKTEYCNLQTDYKTLKTENNQMKLRTTEMQGKL